MLKKIQKIVIYLLSAYAILGFIVLPLVLKPQLVEIAQKETNAKVKVDSVYFNPFNFRLKINGIELNEADDSKLISLKSLTVNLEPYSLFKAAVHVKNLALEEPDIHLVYKKDKSLNIASIIKEKAQEDPTASSESDMEMPRVIVDRIAIIDGSINYKDYTNKTPFDFSFAHIGFEIKDIDTADFNSSDATLKFHTALGDGGFFNLKSRVIGFKPLIVEGSLDFEASKLYTEWKYVQDMLNLEVADGKINFNAKYYFNLDDLDATSVNNLNIAVTNLRIKPKNKYKDVLNIEQFLVSNVTVKPMKQYVHISEVALDSLHVKVKRDAKKEIDWLEYIKTNFSENNNTTVEKAVENEEESKPWEVVVDDIALEKIKVDFTDAGINPNVTTKLNDFNLYVKNVTLVGEKPLSYDMNLRLNEEFVCSSSGDVIHKVLDVKTYTKCSGFDIVRFRPYIDDVARDALSVYNIKLQRATVGFDAKVNVLELEDQTQVSVSDANINLSKVAVNKRSTGERLVDFVDFGVNGLSLDTKTRDVNIEKTTLKNINIRTGLYKDGKLNIDNLVVVKKAKKSKKLKAAKTTKSLKEPDYRVVLKHFALQSARVSFNDKTLKPALNTKLDRIYFNAYNIDSKEKTWLNYSLSARLNSKGYAKAKGKVRHTPLKHIGTFDLKKISLKEFSPYIEKDLYLKLNDGYVNLKSKVEYAKSSKTADLNVHGRLDINEFFLNDSRDDSTLLSFNNMALKSFNYEMFPDGAFVNELDINGFYVNALIDETKTMNFATLSKAPKIKSDANATKSEETNSTKEAKFPFKIMKLNVASGSAIFADFSLPLKFKTNIHDLNGVVYSISSQAGEVSYVDIVGEIDKYGSTKLLGSVDSSNPKLYTDLSFNFRNLELNSLSGYSADFAGYKIDSGKLFLDLGYEILDSQMLGKNSIIVKNIELGDEIKDENSSSLPLGFAIALLEDSEGVIDINMPVEGNVDAPDFKYGALVWKTFGNLIIKAVASPFKFLGSMMGLEGEELEFVEFEPGLMTILPPEKEKLDNISKLMLKRPKISLKIVPQYDEIQDTWILKQQKLIASVMKKSGVKNKKEQQNSMNIDLLEDIYEELAPKKKVSDIEKSLEKTYKGDALDRAYQNTLVKETTQMQVVTLEELQSLANKRAQLLKEYLVNIRAINTNRITLQAVQNVETEKESWVRTKMEIDIK